MRYALLGSGGFIAPRHVKAINDVGSELVLTCDINPDAGADYLDYREMFASEEFKSVDAVSICTPNYLHPEMVRDALRTGKRVMCEKPLTINTDFTGMDGVYVVHQLRFHPHFDEMVAAIRKARSIEIIMKAYRDEKFWSTWKGDEIKSGGVVYIMGAHAFDLLLCALPQQFFVEFVEDSMKKSKGRIAFDGGPSIEFYIEFLDSKEGQTRHFIIDDKKYELSIMDNLSFEGLHDRVYRAFESGVPSNFQDAVRCVKLMDAIKRAKYR